MANINNVTPETMQLLNQTKNTLVREVSNGKKNKVKKMIPRPPKPGELIKCQHCGEIMRPENFHKDPTIRRREFKWHMHYICMEFLNNQCDMQTQGYLDEKRLQELEIEKLKKKERRSLL